MMLLDMKLTERKGWLQNMKTINWTPKTYDTLCSLHFDDECFDKHFNRTTLKPGSIPTIFEEHIDAHLPQVCYHSLNNFVNTNGAVLKPKGVVKIIDNVGEDLVQNIIGAFGKYQLMICLAMFFSKFFVAYQLLGIIFLAPKVVYKCGEDAELNNTCPCSNPIYDKSVFTNTIIMEWNLICERKWMASFTQTIFQLGTLLGSVIFGMASDRFGRKLPLLCAVVLQMTASISAAFAGSYWLFILLRFFGGASVGGTLVISFVIVMEFVGTEYRDVMAALYQAPFNLGHMMLPLYAYFFRTFRNFQLIISIPSILMLTYFFLIPESPRWLIASKKSEKAIDIMKKVAKVNKRPTETIAAKVELHQASLEKNDLKKTSILDLFKTPNMRKNILAMSFLWISCSYCFYGVSQYVGQLSGDIFINVTSSACVTLLGTFLSIPLFKMIGRRTLSIIFCFTSSVCILLLTVIPAGIGSVICATVGVVSSFIEFVIVYLYCSELFPTVVRNAALGFSSMMARVGSMIAPFINDLSDVAPWLPPLLFALVPFVAGCVSFILPETKGCVLMTTIDEGENFGKVSKPKLAANQRV